MKKTSKKVLGVLGIGLIGMGIGAVAGASLAYNPFNQADLDSAKQLSFKAGSDSVVVPAPVIEFVDVPYEVEKIVDREVFVENFDSYDKLEALLADREIYDDAYSVLEQLDAEDVAMKLAIQEIKDELAEELDDKDFVDDEDDVDDIDIEEDYDEINVIKSDFEEDFYKFEFQVEFEDEDLDEKFDLLVKVEVDEGRARIKNIQYV